MKSRLHPVAISAFCMLALAGCPLPGEIRVRDGAPADADAADGVTDVVPDTTDEVAPDAPQDTADVPSDVPVDQPLDTPPDIRVDVPIDMPVDTPPADVADVAPDTGPMLPRFHRIVGGALHTCVLQRSTGFAYCWGGNYGGQIGNGTMSQQLMPLRVDTSAGMPLAFTDLAAGYDFTCGGSTTQLYCWGGNTNGQLGIGRAGAAELRPVLQATPSLGSTVAGYRHACQARSGSPAGCWGINSIGQLGTNDTMQRNARATLSHSMPDSVIAISTRFEASCALVSGSPPLVYCWGWCQASNCGSASGNLTVPTLVGTFTDAAELTVGREHTCIRRASGRVACIGSNGAGQLGRTTSGMYDAIAADVTGLSSVVQLAAGDYHTCARRTDGTVWCWGRNDAGQLAVPAISPMNHRESAAQIAGLANVVEIAAGANHTCAILADSSVYCWGGNAEGQLGDSVPMMRSAGIVRVLGLPPS